MRRSLCGGFVLHGGFSPARTPQSFFSGSLLRSNHPCGWSATPFSVASRQTLKAKNGLFDLSALGPQLRENGTKVHVLPQYHRAIGSNVNELGEANENLAGRNAIAGRSFCGRSCRVSPDAAPRCKQPRVMCPSGAKADPQGRAAVCHPRIPAPCREWRIHLA